MAQTRGGVTRVELGGSPSHWPAGSFLNPGHVPALETENGQIRINEGIKKVRVFSQLLQYAEEGWLPGCGALRPGLPRGQESAPRSEQSGGKTEEKRRRGSLAPSGVLK